MLNPLNNPENYGARTEFARRDPLRQSSKIQQHTNLITAFVKILALINNELFSDMHIQAVS